jgi:hypothetical protein
MKELKLKNYHKISLDFSINCFSMDAPKCATNLNPSFNTCHTLFIWIMEWEGKGTRKNEEL